MSDDKNKKNKKQLTELFDELHSAMEWEASTRRVFISTSQSARAAVIEAEARLKMFMDMLDNGD